MSVTIPAACLDALGGLVETDAPVMWGGVMTAAGESVMMYDFSHPLASPMAPMGRILLPQSAPALLQVLARHVGPLDCPTITPSMSRMEALAEVVVWLARIERMGCTFAHNEGPLRMAEERLGLPEWKVTP